jgi:Electron transfer DM13
LTKKNTYILIVENSSMKFTNLFLTSCATALTISSATLLGSPWHSAHAGTNAEGRAATANQTMNAGAGVSMVNVLASGKFVASEYPTTGLAEIVMQNGEKYLKLSEKFQSADGPDVFVLLHRQDAPKNYQSSNYVSLGRLQKTSGSQLYRIPSNVDVTGFKSVVIWCRQFNATFGFAPIALAK